MTQINLDEILTGVTKPARYTGGEWNTIRKNHNEIDIKVALAFPDVYEVGMSYLGFKILYHLLNKRIDTVAERTYAPWVDMEAKMRQQGIRLYTLESYTPLVDFDLVGFTLQYEMSYTNILNMLDLGGIPLRAEDRTTDAPFIIGGGPCAYNPEPVAEFFDFIVIGEGEEVFGEIIDVLKVWKLRDKKAGGRRELLRRVARIEGVYVPAFYQVEYDREGTIAKIAPLEAGIPATVYKRVVKDLDAVDYPTRPVVPFTESVHDRAMLEVFRGCARGCRFCQAGMIYRPVRERSLKKLQELARKIIENTGYHEISLTSLSTSDYSCVRELIENLNEEFKHQRVGVSLPSLRIDSFSVGLAEQVQEVRKSGLTFAPEAGTQRLRNVINKGVNEENLIDAVSAAFRAGWTTIKLYFMIGLPTETEEDIKGISDLAYRVLDTYRQISREQGKHRPLQLTVSTSTFVPKPHTPLQWEPQATAEEINTKQEYLRNLLKDRRIKYNWHDQRLSFLEAVFAVGDRRLAPVLLRAWEMGCKFDGWSEYFQFERWMQAFDACGIDPQFYAHRRRSYEEILPWEHISCGVSKEFLIAEHRRALQGELTVDCRYATCTQCGVCPTLKVKTHREVNRHEATHQGQVG